MQKLQISLEDAKRLFNIQKPGEYEVIHTFEYGLIYPGDGMERIETKVLITVV